MWGLSILSMFLLIKKKGTDNSHLNVIHALKKAWTTSNNNLATKTPAKGAQKNLEYLDFTIRIKFTVF